MKILSIETTTNCGSIAVIEDEVVKKEIFFKSDDIAFELSEKLDYIYEEFDYISVSIGPGSWTGIRVGISFAKGLACGERLRIYGISTFEGLFYPFKFTNLSVLCIIPATKESFYFSYLSKGYRYKKNFTFKLTYIEKILSLIKKKKFLVIGPGVPLLKDRIDLRRINTNSFFWFPRASLNGLVAFEKIKMGIPSPPIEPLYGK